MASFNPRKFAAPDRLREIAPAKLEALLLPWREYLVGRGFEFRISTTAEVDYPGLANILMQPDATTPAALIDALYYVHEVASADDMDQLIAAIRSRGLPVADDAATTPIDLAIDVWMAAPDMVRAHHAEAIAMRQENFEYFGPSQPTPGVSPIMDDELRRRLESGCDDWFESHRRGRGCRMFVISRSPRTWILVRHGLPMRREASQKDDGGVGTEFYRPQRHDVLIYDQRSGELGVNAGTKGERNLYLRTLGAHLFSGENHFAPAKRFALDPLITHGAQALSVDDVDGIKRVRLVEFRRYWGGASRESETRRAEDVFAALAARNRELSAGGRLTSATFKVAFEESEKERSVTIRPPAIARYERNDDSELIERWLRRRGFILSAQDVEDDEAPTAVLESA